MEPGFSSEYASFLFDVAFESGSEFWSESESGSEFEGGSDGSGNFFSVHDYGLPCSYASLLTHSREPKAESESDVARLQRNDPSLKTLRFVTLKISLQQALYMQLTICAGAIKAMFWCWLRPWPPTPR